MRLAAGIKVSALLRRVGSEGGFATVLARGDVTAGSIAVIHRQIGAEDVLLTPMMAASGGYAYQETARGAAIAEWTARARQRDPDLWIIELDIPDAARFIADILTGD
jgi:hypothetical protein